MMACDAQSKREDEDRTDWIGDMESVFGTPINAYHTIATHTLLNQSVVYMHQVGKHGLQSTCFERTPLASSRTPSGEGLCLNI